MDHTETSKLVTARIKDLGYKVLEHGDDLFESAASGWKFFIKTYGTNIQFRCHIKIEDNDVDWLRFVNDFNTKNRFIKVYMQLEENALIAETDWLITPSNDSETDIIESVMEIWEISLADLKRMLRDQE